MQTREAEQLESRTRRADDREPARLTREPPAHTVQQMERGRVEEGNLTEIDRDVRVAVAHGVVQAFVQGGKALATDGRGRISRNLRAAPPR